MGLVKEKVGQWGLTILGVLGIFVGTSIFATEQTVWSKFIVLAAIAVLLGTEIGWRKFVDKEFSAMEIVSGLAIVAIAIVALSIPFGYAVWAPILANVNAIVIVGSALVIAQAWFIK